MVGVDVTKARPLDAISRISPRPILLIHSADDDNATTPLDGARRLFAAAGEPKDLWVAPRGGQNDELRIRGIKRHARVLAFLRQAFR